MLAIDFGTSRIKVAYIENGEVYLAAFGDGGKNYMPSLFYLTEDGDILVGDQAALMLQDDPKGVIDTLKRKLRQRAIRIKGRPRKKPKDFLVAMFSYLRKRVSEELFVFSGACTINCVNRKIG